MQIDAKMTSNQTDNELMEQEVLMEHTNIRTGTDGIVQGSDNQSKKSISQSNFYLWQEK